MQIDKQHILTLLQTLGQHHKAGAADAELPDQVDTEQHSLILDKLGIDVSDLLGGGGAGGTGPGGLGGIAGKLGL